MHNLYFPPLLSQFSVVTLNCTFLSQLPQNVSQPLWKSIQHFLLVSPLLPAGVPMSEQSKKLVCLLSHWSQDSQQGLHLYWFPVKQHLSPLVLRDMRSRRVLCASVQVLMGFGLQGAQQHRGFKPNYYYIAPRTYCSHVLRAIANQARLQTSRHICRGGSKDEKAILLEQICQV